MRILAALQHRHLDREVIAAVQHLAQPGDDVHLLVLLSPRDVHETVSRRSPHLAIEEADVVTTTGLLVPAMRVRPLPAESETQATVRARAEALAAIRDETVRFAPGVRVHLDAEVARDPVRAVVEAAGRLRAHGIAVGGDERPALLRWLRPDLAERVTRAAAVPVLVVQPRVRVPRPALRQPAAA